MLQLITAERANDYAARNAAIGSIREARRAGKYPASPATQTSAATVAK